MIKAKITAEGKVEVVFDRTDGYKEAIDWRREIEMALGNGSKITETPTVTAPTTPPPPVGEVNCPKHTKYKLKTWTYQGKQLTGHTWKGKDGKTWFRCDGINITKE